MRSHYFAYGSNMDELEMGAHCPSAVCLGAARLDEHRLAFLRRSARTGTGVADVVSDPGATVWGAVWEIGEEDLVALDRKEGEGLAYARRETLVTRPLPLPALTRTVYLVQRREGSLSVAAQTLHDLIVARLGSLKFD